MITNFEQVCRDWELLFEQEHESSPAPAAAKINKERPHVDVTDFHYGYPFRDSKGTLNFRIIADDDYQTNKLHLTWCGRLENMDAEKNIAEKLKAVSLEDLSDKAYKKSRMCVSCLRLLYGTNIKMPYSDYVNQEMQYFDTKEIRTQIKDTLFHMLDVYKDGNVTPASEVPCSKCGQKFPRDIENFKLYFEDGNTYNTHRHNVHCYCNACYEALGVNQRPQDVIAASFEPVKTEHKRSKTSLERYVHQKLQEANYNVEFLHDCPSLSGKFDWEVSFISKQHKTAIEVRNWGSYENLKKTTALSDNEWTVHHVWNMESADELIALLKN